jgi:hypothetical protein
VIGERTAEVSDLSQRGQAAAEIQTTARAALDNELESSVGARAVENARRTLVALIELGRH